jgi:uncharacterized membrane protein
MVVPLPIGSLIFALVCDIVYAVGGDPFWATAAMWLIGAGIVTGLVAGVLGAIEFITIARARNGTGWIHAIGNIAAIILAAVNFGLRMPDSAAVIVPEGLILSIIIVGILLVTGWTGGELAYRHKIGVID